MDSDVTAKTDPKGGKITLYFNPERLSVIKRIPPRQISSVVGELIDAWANSPKGQAMLKAFDTLSEELRLIDQEG